MEINNSLMGKGMRRVMLAAALLNTLGAIIFIPALSGLRAQGHLPNDAHPVYLWMIALWIFFFGVAYLYLGITGRVEKVFVAVGAAGKLSFFGLLLGFALAGGLPIQAVTSGIADLIFGTIFAVWLWRTRTLEQSINKDDRNKKLWAAHGKFTRTAIAEDIEIDDVFDNLEEK